MLADTSMDILYLASTTLNVPVSHCRLAPHNLPAHHTLWAALARTSTPSKWLLPLYNWQEVLSNTGTLLSKATPALGRVGSRPILPHQYTHNSFGLALRATAGDCSQTSQEPAPPTSAPAAVMTQFQQESTQQTDPECLVLVVRRDYTSGPTEHLTKDYYLQDHKT